MKQAMEVFDMTTLEHNAFARYLLGKGEAKGREEGREESKKEFAIKMMKQGYELEQIIKLTGFSAEELEAMRESTIGEPE